MVETRRGLHGDPRQRGVDRHRTRLARCEGSSHVLEPCRRTHLSALAGGGRIRDPVGRVRAGRKGLRPATSSSTPGGKLGRRAARRLAEREPVQEIAPPRPAGVDGHDTASAAAAAAQQNVDRDHPLHQGRLGESSRSARWSGAGLGRRRIRQLRSTTVLRGAAGARDDVGAESRAWSEDAREAEQVKPRRGSRLLSARPDEQAPQSHYLTTNEHQGCPYAGKHSRTDGPRSHVLLDRV